MSVMRRPLRRRDARRNDIGKRMLDVRLVIPRMRGPLPKKITHAEHGYAHRAKGHAHPRRRSPRSRHGPGDASPRRARQKNSAVVFRALGCVTRRNRQPAIAQIAICSALPGEGRRSGHHHAMGRGCSNAEAALRKENLIMATKKKKQRPGRRRREAASRGGGEAPHEHDASRAPGELVHAGAGHEQASNARHSALRRGRGQSLDQGEDRQRSHPDAGSARFYERVRVVREGGLRIFAGRARRLRNHSEGARAPHGRGQGGGCRKARATRAARHTLGRSRRRPSRATSLASP